MKTLKKIILFIIIAVISEAKLYQTLLIFRHGARYHTNDILDGNATYPMRS